jgi:ATP/maltotriose-dependent transcriptional regulator MalT
MQAPMDLIERDAQLAQLRACVSAAAGGAGGVALVAGEAGIGKTTLVREFADSCKEFALWWGSCDALQTPNPLAPLHDIARSSNARFRTLLDRHVKGSALFGEVIRELQDLGPTLVVIEDAHWADESTLDLIRFLGRRIDRTHAVLVVTFREDEVSAAHPLRTVIGDLPLSLTTRIALQPLSEDAVETLAQRALRSPTGLHSATGGNPFFLTELLRHGSVDLPQSIQDLVLARFARLAPKPREIVQLAAIVPAKVERWLVNELLLPSADDLEACLDSGLLLVDENSLFFRHELARVSIEKAISLPVAESLHARAYQALVSRDEQSEYGARIVHHATHANARDAVLMFAPAAAREACERGAHREAAAHYSTALRFAEGLPIAEHVALLEAHAVESQAVHRLCDAIESREKVARLLEGKQSVPAQARNLSQLALDFVLSLENVKADASSRRAIELLEKLPPSVELANAYRVEAQLRMLHRDCRESVEWGEKAIALAERFGDKPVLAAAYATVGAALLFIDYPAGIDRLQRALDIALKHGLDYIAANSYSNLGSASGELFRLREAERHLQTAIQFATTKEIDFYRTYAFAWLSLCDLYLGRWDEAETHAAEALGGATEVSTARLMAICAIGRVRVRRGGAGAEALLDEAASLAFSTGTLQRVAPVRAARAEAAFQRGDHARVIAEAGAALELARRHSHPWHVGELSYWLWREGAAAAPLAECAEPYALQMAGKWREAAAAWGRLECPYEQARALADGNDEAKREALAIFERLGARPAADALRKGLREAGVRGLPRGPRASTQRNPRGLTAREIEILELLCMGLKNSEIAERLFRSVRTVEHHVDSILGKLEAKSRSEVPVIVHRDKLLAPRMGTPAPEST